jgi:DNA-binding CsgD family transcriptional regulator
MPNHQYLKDLLKSLRELFGTRETFTLRSIRRQYLPYFFAFPLAMVFVNVEDFFLSGHTGIPGLPPAAYAFLAFTAGAMVFFICCREDNAAVVSRIASVLAFAGIVPWLILPEGYRAFLSMLVLMAGIGGCVSCASFSFVFVLNNTERFFGCALMLVLIRLIKLLALLPPAPLFFRKALALVLVAALTVSMFHCRQEDFSGKSTREKVQFNGSIRLTVFLLIAYFAIRITGFYAPAFRYLPSSFLYGILELLPLFLCIVVQSVFRGSVWTLCNVFFLSSLFSYGMWHAGLPEMAHLFAELKEIGFLAVFYLVGCVTNRFCNFRMHKQLVLLCMALIGVLFLTVELLQIRLPGTPVAVITVSVFFAAFLLLSPALSRSLFFADWSKELYEVCMLLPKAGRADPDTLKRQVSSLDHTCLSPREKQVTLLLLQGLTLRQIAPELKLTPSTVATYSKSIYKKLGINSRAELFLRFGAAFVRKDEESF